jgi:NADH-quinone oxidoreductase subunit E
VWPVAGSRRRPAEEGEKMDAASIDPLIAKYEYNESSLIAILQDIQREARYLPPEVMRHLADRLNVPLTRIYGIATFYKAFSLHPKGRHVCSVCTGTACHVRGAPRLLDKLERDLKVKSGETTPDRRFTVQTVNCVGACALGPVVVIDDDYHGKLTAAKLDKVVKAYR